METCRLCTLLRESPIIHEGKGFVIIQVDSVKIATSTEHTTFCDPKTTAMVIEYFKDHLSGCVLSDYEECVGHWGIRLIPHMASSQASARARDQ